MAVEIRVTYSGDLHCKAVHGPSSQMLTTDAPVDNGGRGEFFSPTDLIATALGSCILTVMGLVAQRGGIDLAGTEVRVTKEMTASPVRRIGSLVARVTFPSSLDLSGEMREKLKRAAELCPVKASLHPDVALVLEFAG